MTPEPAPTQTIETPAERPIVARGVARTGDYARAWWVYNVSKTGRWARTLGVFLLVACVLTGFLLVVLGQGMKVWIIGALLAYLALVFAFQALYPGWVINRHAKRKPGSSQWQFRPSGMTLDGPHQHATWDWDAFLGAAQSRRIVLILITPKMYYVFSRPMFEDDESWRAFSKLVRRQLMGCVKCGYTLKGSAADTCPECGHPIT